MADAPDISESYTIDDKLQLLIKATSSLITYDALDDDFHDASESIVPDLHLINAPVHPTEPTPTLASPNAQPRANTGELPGLTGHAPVLADTHSTTPRKRKVKRTHYPKYTRIPAKISSNSSSHDLLAQQINLVNMINGCGGTTSSRYGELDTFSNMLHSASTSKASSRGSGTKGKSIPDPQN